MPMYRRSWSAASIAIVGVALCLMSCSGALPTAPRPVAPSPTTTPPTTSTPPATAAAWPDTIGGFERPTEIAAPDDGSDRLFVTEQRGVIRVVRAGTLLGSPALDIRGRVGSSGSEQGLLGLAFPPGFASKGYAYIHYTDTSGTSRVYRVRVSAKDPDRFDPSTMQAILSVRQPFANHNGGQLAFGPDGYLYVGLGDGGGGGDPGNRARSLSTLLGKILRIDTESTPDSSGYRVPEDNPFVARAGARPEIWEYGLRNPWRFSFDGATGDLWIADVGQNAWEEIDHVPGGTGGLDFGWSLYEGNNLFKAKAKHAGTVWPVFEYSHRLGESVTGGYVYRGSAYTDMQGLYVFGDFGSGRIWTLRRDGSRWVARLARTTSYSISTFGLDGSKELWVADYATGDIHSIGDLSR